MRTMKAGRTKQRTKQLTYFLAALLAVVMAVTIFVYVSIDKSSNADAAEESRKIYIGDIFTVEITAERLSSEEIAELFRDFEIVELKQDRGRFLVSVRTFDPGEYLVPIGDKELVVTVASILEDIERDDVFEGSSEVLKPAINWPWRLLFYAAAGVFVVACGVLAAKALLQRWARSLSPYELFLKEAGALAVDSRSYFVDLTLLFKRYLEGLYSFRIIGKTSAEILSELSRLNDLDNLLPDIETWLVECDRFKFSGIPVAREQKQAHYQRLLGVVETINKQVLDGKREGAG